MSVRMLAGRSCRFVSVAVVYVLVSMSALGAAAGALETSGMQISMKAEVREAVGDVSAPTYRLKPAVRVSQGTRLYYTVEMRNTTDKALKDVVVVRQIPDHTRYVPDSATGAGADIAVSTDGGQSFTAQQSRCAGPEEGAAVSALPCTHLRWTLRHPVPPGAVVLARFAVVFN